MRIIRYVRLKDGRKGMIRHYNVDNTAHVQLGADGPFEDIPDSELKTISDAEFNDG